MDNRTIKLYKWFDLYTEPIISIEDLQLDVKIPTNCDDCLPIFDPIDGYSTFTKENNYDYFASLLDGETRITVINGENFSELSRRYPCCDYCETMIDFRAYPIRFCSQCEQNICSLCWEEKTEQIAIKHGAKNWKNRKDKLLTCFEHENKFLISKQITVNCNICEKSSKIVNGKWFCNRDADIDICPSCFYKEEGQELIRDSEGKWNETEYKEQPANKTIGSMLDWVVLLKDERGEYDYLLYNINKDSANYHRVILVAVDDHYREGFYLVEGSLQDNLDKIKQIGIKNILTELNHEVHFG
jgi:hypothetical protein